MTWLLANNNTFFKYLRITVTIYVTTIIYSKKNAYTFTVSNYYFKKGPAEKQAKEIINQAQPLCHEKK